MNIEENTSDKHAIIEIHGVTRAYKKAVTAFLDPLVQKNQGGIGHCQMLWEGGRPKLRIENRRAENNKKRALRKTELTLPFPKIPHEYQKKKGNCPIKRQLQQAKQEGEPRQLASAGHST